MPFALRSACWLAISLLATSSFASNHDLLVDADWLAANQDSAELVLLHVEQSQSNFEEQHIPGARWLPYRSIVENRQVEGGTLINELPAPEKLTEVFRSVGVNGDSHVVVYGHPVFASRAFLTFEQMGHERVSLLDGGVLAWQASGNPVESGATPAIAAGNFESAPRSDILVDATWINEQRQKSGVVLLDSRPLNEFSGADGGMGGRFEAGHIPGARNLYWEELVAPAGETNQGRFLAPEALRARFAKAGADADDTLVSYCFIGMRASVNYFLGRMLGYPTKFYDGSWNDWSMTGYETETGPDPTAPFSEVARRDEQGWITLFDGYTLNGWRASENTESWSVEDGALTCHGPRSHLYFVGGDEEKDHTFTDFELTAEVRTTHGSNSGIYFHTRWQETGWPKYGYEAQVNQTQTDPKKTGSLYDVVNVLEQLAKDDEWYTQSIRVQGRKVTIKVNGKIAVEYQEPEGKEAHSEDFERRLGSGTFALQAHDPASKVQFRNLRVRRID